MHGPHSHVWLIDVTSCQQINNNEASSNPVDEITSNDICGINPSNYTADFPLEVDSPHISQTTSNTVSPSSESKTTGSEGAYPQFHSSTHKLRTNTTSVTQDTVTTVKVTLNFIGRRLKSNRQTSTYFHPFIK